MTEKQFELNEFIKSIRPKCPYCGADTTYAYYGIDGSRYCPHCMKNLKMLDG